MTKPDFQNFDFLRYLPIGSSVNFDPFSIFPLFAIISAILNDKTVKFRHTGPLYAPSDMETLFFQNCDFQGQGCPFGLKSVVRDNLNHLKS